MARRGAEARQSKGALWQLLGGAGCVILLLLCAVGVGIWWWNRTPTDKGQVEQPLANDDKRKDKGEKSPDKVLPIKPKNPLAATGPVGNVPDSAFAPPMDVWEFTLRLPKGMTPVLANPKGEKYPGYAWKSERKEDSRSVLLVKQRDGADRDPFELFTPRKGPKPDPKSPFQSSHAHLQMVEIHGLPGARIWEIQKNPSGLSIVVNYRFHIDGWAYLFHAIVSERTEADTRKTAELFDAAICTFRKR